MSVNIEIKARASDFQRQMGLAAELADTGPRLLRQRDTFFVVSRGRLKLRDFGDGQGELIHYDRPDQKGPKRSQYSLATVDDPEAMRRVLADSLGIRGEVVKRRTLFLMGSTRIHFDVVKDLGKFIELEVVMALDQALENGQDIAQRLMQDLAIRSEDLIEGAYIDLLESRD